MGIFWFQRCVFFVSFFFICMFFVLSFLLSILLFVATIVWLLLSLLHRLFDIICYSRTYNVDINIHSRLWLSIIWRFVSTHTHATETMGGLNSNQMVEVVKTTPIQFHWRRYKNWIKLKVKWNSNRNS